MSKRIDLSGQLFGRLTVGTETDKQNGKLRWLCRCDCGNELFVLGSSLRSGNTSSCGCLHNELLAESNKVSKKTHGLRHTRLYGIWQGMKKRCYVQSNKDYSRYGGRGILICTEWLNDFQSFYDWAVANGYSDSLTIDRIDSDGNYTPENCRWTTTKSQNVNRRTTRLISFNGTTQCLAHWASDLGISRATLRNRLDGRQLSLDRALVR